MADESIAALLPLQPTAFHILLSLTDEDRHGYAIILEVSRRTQGELKLSAGTLYRSIQRIPETGLILETRTRLAPPMDDERRRYYRITPSAERSPSRRPGDCVICSEWRARAESHRGQPREPLPHASLAARLLQALPAGVNPADALTFSSAVACACSPPC